MKELKRHVDWRDISTVIDCGASVGEWTKWAYRLFPRAHIWAFEPLPATALKWIDWARKRAERVTLQVCALGEREGTVAFEEHVCHPSSSSILHRTQKSVEIYPVTAEVRQVEVSMRMLDDCIPADVPREILVKLDCQGYEGHIFEGGTRVFSAARCVVCEAMMTPLYEGQVTFDDIVACMARFGLAYQGNVTQEFERGELQFVDAVFVREAR